MMVIAESPPVKELIYRISRRGADARAHTCNMPSFFGWSRFGLMENCAMGVG